MTIWGSIGARCMWKRRKIVATTIVRNRSELRKGGATSLQPKKDGPPYPIVRSLIN
jgi:hypothetical protein